MGKSCTHKVPCGCGDQPLMTPPPCETGTQECPAPDPCSETFSDECLVHAGDTIVDTGIVQGERLDVTLQRLSLILTNPACMLPGSTCQPALGLKSTEITSTTISLAWLNSLTATGYTLEFKEASSLTWTLTTPIAVVANPTYMIGGLTPDTDYHVRINTICAAGNCYTVTILVKTKS